MILRAASHLSKQVGGGRHGGGASQSRPHVALEGRFGPCDDAPQLGAHDGGARCCVSHTSRAAGGVPKVVLVGREALLNCLAGASGELSDRTWRPGAMTYQRGVRPLCVGDARAAAAGVTIVIGSGEEGPESLVRDTCTNDPATRGYPRACAPQWVARSSASVMASRPASEDSWVRQENPSARTIALGCAATAGPKALSNT